MSQNAKDLTFKGGWDRALKPDEETRQNSSNILITLAISQNFPAFSWARAIHERATVFTSELRG
ncbi:hypothetical protein PROFUN_13222 [Planoprotostelium fungivorum]|uniref:Uncharacterized protein n=1 Tax=Planoprotostelium fungivorum TaxID=1890364 RepID=A0A2P6MYV3_9EUKA|nr:hypothetical protein PROFUN_13222 [Planoprotostelium fungivorum]